MANNICALVDPAVESVQTTIPLLRKSADNMVKAILALPKEGSVMEVDYEYNATNFKRFSDFY